jgi:amidase
MTTSKSDVSRREFLRTAGGISSIALVGGLGVSFASAPAKAAAAKADIKNYGAFCDFNPAQVKGAAQGPLAGLQMGVKDVFDIAGFRTGAGNPDWLRTHPPATKTAPAVQKLLDAGASVRGKTITDELTFSLNGENAHYGTPVNPVSPDRIPGGSSCGSTVAVAAGLCDFALGTDTAGSVRLPASFCGNFGMRPTWGAVNNDLVVPLAPSYDVVGWFARDLPMLTRVGEVLLPPDTAKNFTGETVLFPDDAWELALPEVRAALRPCVNIVAGSARQFRRFTLSKEGYLRWQYVFRTIEGYEVWKAHGEWVTATKPNFGPGIRERFQWASTIKAEEVQPLMPERQAIANQLHALLENSILVIPTVPFYAPMKNSPTSEDNRTRALTILCLSPMGGLPQITVPVAMASGCAVGMSLIGPPGSDRALLKQAERLVECKRQQDGCKA